MNKSKQKKTLKIDKYRRYATTRKQQIIDLFCNYYIHAHTYIITVAVNVIVIGLIVSPRKEKKKAIKRGVYFCSLTRIVLTMSEKWRTEYTNTIFFLSRYLREKARDYKREWTWNRAHIDDNHIIKIFIYFLLKISKAIAYKTRYFKGYLKRAHRKLFLYQLEIDLYLIGKISGHKFLAKRKYRVRYFNGSA